MEGTYLPAADVYTGAGTKQIQISQGFNPKSMVDVSLSVVSYLCCMCVSLLYVCISVVRVRAREYGVCGLCSKNVPKLFMCLCFLPSCVIHQ